MMELRGQQYQQPTQNCYVSFQNKLLIIEFGVASLNKIYFNFHIVFFYLKILLFIATNPQILTFPRRLRLLVPGAVQPP